MYVKILKEFLTKQGTSKGQWFAEYVSDARYPVNELQKGQKLFFYSEEIGEANINQTVSIEDYKVLILNPDGSCGGTFVKLPITPIEKGFTEAERRVVYPPLCTPQEAERVFQQIAQETKG